MSDGNDNKNNFEPVVVRLDESARNEAQSILYHAYREDPTFQYLFDHRRPGYDQRVRATVRELVDLYFEHEQEAVGVMVDHTLVAVAFVGEPELRLNLAQQLSWRIRMVLTAGFASTRRYLEYHEKIRGLLPQPQAHQLPLMGVDPKYQNRGYGRVLLRAVERLCEDNPRGSGLVLDTGNSRYLPFYESEGFRSLGKIRMGDFEDHVLFRQLSEARPAASAAPS
ncbi:GNAT family N-acetyltransferase [Marinobacter lutaoensis]|jgi:GNAT superfamily N-acetyltransferase|uniref:GNAT family N-acetyltransferase n=1 Tax=Marinobacter lutaoensis TaxID=135739 RepID=A0A1V2DTL2_9GAMM|nr:GNAT family N-acetyltransferase [Marinobacter lutaoensis]MBE02134.1 GNAT family N-acetyltransferase [Marinobacter sp.]MBI42424.1 GNAT family N-acetyltransferase [Oceanospirillales bacterium]NVD35526.1 GNAT family N-acetyltransferase [Marinobacter lutaoensis]ONF44075.1 GNAT family N-acetyltransferase [Marinobacter lutaoensis]|tara:strand:- start:5534 stop:6205 length:672 start_codon:yes stop_codon:yes gene_type:complete